MLQDEKAGGSELDDLFEVPKITDDDMDASDLFALDPEVDVMDADPDGTLDSLVTVSEDDIMGEGYTAEREAKEAEKEAEKGAEEIEKVKPYSFAPPRPQVPPIVRTRPIVQGRYLPVNTIQGIKGQGQL